MPIQISWHDTLPNTIYYNIIGQWSWQDYEDAFQEELRMALSLNDQQYNVIANLLDTSLIPKGNAFSFLIETVKYSPLNMGQVVMVTSNNLIRTMLATFIKVHPSIQESLYVTHSLDDAETYLIKSSSVSSLR